MQASSIELGCEVRNKARMANVLRPLLDFTFDYAGIVSLHEDFMPWESLTVYCIVLRLLRQCCDCPSQ